jgi:hypothetical protein
MPARDPDDHVKRAVLMRKLRNYAGRVANLPLLGPCQTWPRWQKQGPCLKRRHGWFRRRLDAIERGFAI